VVLVAAWPLLKIGIAAGRYALVLKQCANFHNNIATQMIPSQKPMMLADAIEFEQVGVLWGGRPPWAWAWACTACTPTRDNCLQYTCTQATTYRPHGNSSAVASQV
jgi:hypothetical protein